MSTDCSNFAAHQPLSRQEPATRAPSGIAQAACLKHVTDPGPGWFLFAGVRFLFCFPLCFLFWSSCSKLSLRNKQYLILNDNLEQVSPGPGPSVGGVPRVRLNIDIGSRHFPQFLPYAGSFEGVWFRVRLGTCVGRNCEKDREPY